MNETESLQSALQGVETLLIAIELQLRKNEKQGVRIVAQVSLIMSSILPPELIKY